MQQDRWRQDKDPFERFLRHLGQGEVCWRVAQAVQQHKRVRTILDRYKLKTLEDQKWVHREVLQMHRPPRPIYTAINAGQIIHQKISTEINFGSYRIFY